MVEHNEPVRIDDQFDDPRVHPGSSGPTHGSLICVPLRSGDGAIGGLTIERIGEGRLFTDDEFELAQLFAAQASVALQNAEIHLASTDAAERLREQSAALEQKVRGQRELLQITESILTTLDPPVLLGTIADRLGELIGSDNVSIELIDPVIGLLTPVIARGVDAEYYIQPWQAGETGLATWVLDHNEPVRVVDEFDDDRDPPAADRPGPRQPRVRAAARRATARSACSRSSASARAGCSATTSSSSSSCSRRRPRSRSRTRRSTSPSASAPRPTC